MTYHEAELMATRTANNPTASHEEVLVAAVLADDPEFAEEWHRLALARAVATAIVRHRAEHGLSQRRLAERLGVSQPRVVELESGEKNPTFETLARISAVTGIEFAIDIAPAGTAPRLVGKAVKDSRPHVYSGAAVLIAAR